jgi:predicted dehydrogenase
MTQELTRRELIRVATLAGGLAALGGVWTEGALAQSKSPNEKLNIACIGVGGQGGGDLREVSGENIVALCDVDSIRAAKSFGAYPNAPKYTDYRKMLERKDIDAVTVTIPDHNHAAATAMAMHLGKHVYCQKPLTHSVHEAREIAKLSARNPKLATQMGTQAHASEGNIRTAELLQMGVIGQVTQVHVWTDRPKGWWPQGVTRPTEAVPIRSSLDWNCWLGTAAFRPYNPVYLPFVWRGWWDFGTGSLGDMACHLMDVAFWGLKLGAPVRVSAEGVGMTADSPPLSCVIKYEFPKRSSAAPHDKPHDKRRDKKPASADSVSEASPGGELGPVTLTWYDAKVKPPADLLGGETVPDISNGSLFIGDKGMLLVNHGANPILLPHAKFDGVELPKPFLPRPGNHYLQWIEACKTGTSTGSNFGYAGVMTEAVLLGNVALRVGQPVEYDAIHGKVTNCKEAEQYLQNAYRKGYRL